MYIVNSLNANGNLERIVRDIKYQLHARLVILLYIGMGNT
jgi:hypothetical protein